MSKSKKTKMAKISATIDRFEGEKAVLVLADGQKLVIEKNKLDPSCQEGDLVTFNFSRDAVSSQIKQSNAKKLIKDIFKDKNHET